MKKLHPDRTDKHRRMVPTTFSLPVSMRQRLEQLQQRRQESAAEIVRQALEIYLREAGC